MSENPKPDLTASTPAILARVMAAAVREGQREGAANPQAKAPVAKMLAPRFVSQWRNGHARAIRYAYGLGQFNAQLGGDLPIANLPEMVEQAVRMGAVDETGGLPATSGKEIAQRLGLQATNGHLRGLAQAYGAGRFHAQVMGLR